MSKPVDLPNDVEALKALLVASEDRNLRKQDRIDQLEKLVSELMRWMPPPNGIECAKVVSYEPKKGRHPCQRLAY